MPEYIEREKALKLIESAETWGWSNNTLYDEMKNLPAADVAPVVYGKWEVHEVDCFTKFATCTACGEYATDIPEEIHEQGFNITAHKPVLTRCCPNCGAKMDLEGDK